MSKKVFNAPVILGPAMQIPKDLYFGPIIPDTHTAKFNNEILSSLVFSCQVNPPPGQQNIDVNDNFTLVVAIENTYEHSHAPFHLFKLVPAVWFKDVKVKITPSPYVIIQGETNRNEKTYDVVTGTGRLTPGQSVVKTISLKATGWRQAAGDPNEQIATVKVEAKLDLDAFFKYTNAATVYAQIRNP